MGLHYFLQKRLLFELVILTVNCQLRPAFPVSPSVFLYGFKWLEYNSQAFPWNTGIDPLPANGWERWEWLISKCGLKSGWCDELESVGPILVVSVAKKVLFRPLWKWMGGLLLVPNEYLFLTSQVHTRVGQGRLGWNLNLYWLSGQNRWVRYIYSGMNVRESDADRSWVGWGELSQYAHYLPIANGFRWFSGILRKIPFS